VSRISAYFFNFYSFKNWFLFLFLKALINFILFYLAQFCDYINYTKNLGFEDDPDYNYLKELFKKVMENNNDQFDFMFDWVKKPIAQQNIISRLTNH